MQRRLENRRPSGTNSGVLGQREGKHQCRNRTLAHAKGDEHAQDRQCLTGWKAWSGEPCFSSATRPARPALPGASAAGRMPCLHEPRSAHALTRNARTCLHGPAQTGHTLPRPPATYRWAFPSNKKRESPKVFSRNRFSVFQNCRLHVSRIAPQNPGNVFPFIRKLSRLHFSRLSCLAVTRLLYACCSGGVLEDSQDYEGQDASASEDARDGSQDYEGESHVRPVLAPTQF